MSHLTPWRAFCTVLISVAGAAGCGAAPVSTQGDDLASSSAPLHCAAFDPYTAAIAHGTIACTGTVGPQSFRVDGAGYLERAFDACSAAEAPATSLRDIDDLLAMQRQTVLPNARACFADHWAEWQASFAARGNSACPVWTKVAAEGSPTPAAVVSLAKTLPQPMAGVPGALISSATAETMGRAEENFLYRVTFDGRPPVQSCATPESCAAQCAAGLPGFYVGERDGLVVGDPRWWLDPTWYQPGGSPYMTDNFYHPMSFYRETEIFAARARENEKCSRWNGVYHMMGILKPYCFAGSDGLCPSTECIIEDIVNPDDTL
jgi:hypothetical protein